MFEWFGSVCFVPHTKVAVFAELLRDGKICGTRCAACKTLSVPPRADCPRCLSGQFEWVPLSGRGRLHTFTRIEAAPTGFEDAAPYVLGVVDLEEGGRLLGPVGAIPFEALRVGMPVRLAPRLAEEIEPIRVSFTIEPETASAEGKKP